MVRPRAVAALAAVLLLLVAQSPVRAQGSGDGESGESGEVPGEVLTSSAVLTTFGYSTSALDTTTAADDTVVSTVVKGSTATLPSTVLPSTQPETQTTTTTDTLPPLDLILSFEFDREPPPIVTIGLVNKLLAEQLAKFTGQPSDSFIIEYDNEGAPNSSRRDFNVVVRDTSPANNPFVEAHLRAFATLGQLTVQPGLFVTLVGGKIVQPDGQVVVEWKNNQLPPSHDLTLKFLLTADPSNVTGVKFAYFEEQLRQALAAAVGAEPDEFTIRYQEGGDNPFSKLDFNVIVTDNNSSENKFNAEVLAKLVLSKQVYLLEKDGDISAVLLEAQIEGERGAPRETIIIPAPVAQNQAQQDDGAAVRLGLGLGIGFGLALIVLIALAVLHAKRQKAEGPAVVVTPRELEFVPGQAPISARDGTNLPVGRIYSLV